MTRCIRAGSRAAGKKRQRTWRSPGNLVKVDVLANLLTTRVHLQDLHAPRNIRPVHRHLPVKAPWPQQRRVQHLREAGKSAHMCAGCGAQSPAPGEGLPDRHLPATIIQVANAVAQQLDDPQIMAIQAALDAAQCLLWAGCRLPGHRPQDIITMETSFADQTLLPLQIS